MQVILVCVAHAAQKAWMNGRTAGGDPGVDVMHEGIPATETSQIGVYEEDPAAVSPFPFPPLWESFSGMGENQYAFPAGPVLPADSGQCH